MKSNLPSGWQWSTLGEVCSKPQYGWTSKSSATGKIKYLRTTDITKDNIDWKRVPYCEIEPEDIDKYLIEKNDILVSRAGSVGVSYRVNEIVAPTVFASYLIRFKPNGIDPKWVEYSLHTREYWQSISEAAAGIAVQNVNAVKLSNFPIPIPPLAEQHRIVAKLDEAMQRVEASQARLEKLPGLLKQFRQAVLAAAVSGRLTEAWRAENPAQETGADLLARIRAERRAQWEEKQRAKLSGKQLTLNDSWKQKYEEPAEPDTSELPELPEGWVYDTVGNSIKIIDYRGRTPPFSGDNQDIPHLRSSNVKRGKIIWEGLAYVSAETYEEFMTRGIPKVGDVLLTTEAPLGEVALVPDIKFSLAQRMMVLRPLAGIDPRFLMFQFMSETIQNRLKERGTGTTVTGVAAKHFKPMAIAMPPLSEQQEIARQVTQYFALADSLETRFEQAAAAVEQLPQALLTKAFSGQLVPQDPNDEPASVLLERLRNAPASAKAKRGRKSSISQNQLDFTVPQSLLEILEQHPDGISPEKLFSLAGFTDTDVDSFYQELAKLQPKLEETKPAGVAAKTWPNTSTTLRLKTPSDAN